MGACAYEARSLGRSSPGFFDFGACETVGYLSSTWKNGTLER